MKPYKLGIVLGQKSNAFWIEMQKAYEALAPEFKVQAVYAWPSSDNPEKSQLAELRKMAGQDIQAIIVNPLSRCNLSPGILGAAARKIPVLDVGAKADGKLLGSAGFFYIPVKTVDFYRQGVLGASYIIEKLTPAGGGKTAIIEGDKDSTQSIERSRGAADRFESSQGIHLVERVSANFDRQAAARVSRGILGRHPDLAAFFCANDHMALGVAQTARELGPGKRIIIVGVDLIKEAIPAVQTGQLAASVAFNVRDVANVMLRAAVNRIDGDTGIPDTCTVMSRLVDRQSFP